MEERLIKENEQLRLILGNQVRIKDDLLERINKAIELIECSKEHTLEHDGSKIYLTRYCIDELLKILKGDVDE